MTTVDMKSKQMYLTMPRKPPKVFLKTINPQITCNLCKGYLIDATTIVECLHSFCHSCIMMHLRCETYCPSCEILINEVKPNIKPDATLQAIVYKLVPGLYEKELLRRRAFYKLRTTEALQATPEQRGEDTEHLIFGPNENISLMLEYSDNDNSYKSSDDENSNSGSELRQTDHIDDDFDSQLKIPKYLQCPAICPISNLKKFILGKFGIDPNKFCVEIMYKVKTIALPDHYTLMDVAYIYTWKRDAPMKFFYRVCTATKEPPELPIGDLSNVDDILISSVELVHAKNEYIDNNRYTLSIRDNDHEQSSDADSDIRSDIGSSTTTANGTNAVCKREPEISPLAQTSNNVPPSTTANTRTNNGSDNKRHQSNRNLPREKESIQSPNPSSSGVADVNVTNSTTNRSSEPIERLTDEKSNGPKSNTTQENFTNGNDKATKTPCGSPSRSNQQEVNNSKEKVKIKLINKSETTNKTPSNSSQQSNKVLPIKIADLKSNSLPDAIEQIKSKILLNKDAKTKSLSTAAAESEYDFDQHLLKEKLSEKNEFLNSFNLAPRTAAEVLATKLAKNESKNDQPTDLSKDSKSVSTSITTATTATAATTTTSTPPTLTKPSNDSTILNANERDVKKPENKASKRKSREPVKNIVKMKCPSTSNERLIDQKYQHGGGNGKSSPMLPLSTSSPINFYNDRINDAATSATMQILDIWSQQNKNNLKSVANSNTNKMQRSAFKVPMVDAIAKDTNKSLIQSDTETSIIINNVQRPNQVDTPRPTMSFNSNLSQHFFQPNPSSLPILKRNLFNETEIKEIRSDDASKLKVYGPSMNKPFDAATSLAMAIQDELRTQQHYKPSSIPFLPKYSLNYNLSNQNEPLHLNQLSLKNYPNSHSVHEMLKKSKTKNSNAGVDMKKLISSNALDVISKCNKGNSTPKRQCDQSDDISALCPMKEQKVQTLLNSCNITFPSSLSITLTNDDETDSTSLSRSLFNQKNQNPVNNFIEIVKLPDESSPSEQNRLNQLSKSSALMHIDNRTDNDRSDSSSPVAINLINNRSTALPNTSRATASGSSSSNTTSSSSSSRKGSAADFQAKFIQSITIDKLKNKKKLLKPTRPPMLGHHSFGIDSHSILMGGRSPYKRKPNFNLKINDKASLQKFKEKRLQQRSPARKAIEMKMPQRNLPLMSLPSTSSKSSMDLLVMENIKKQLALQNNNKSASTSTTLPTPTSSSSSASSMPINVDKQSSSGKLLQKYLPLPTSTKPFWTEHYSQKQKVAHEALAENLKQRKNNTSTFIE